MGREKIPEEETSNEEHALSKTNNTETTSDQKTEEAKDVDLLEKLFDVQNFFKGTIYASSLLLVSLIGFFFLFPDMRLHFGVMIVLCAGLLVVVLQQESCMRPNISSFYPQLKAGRDDFIKIQHEEELKIQEEEKKLQAEAREKMAKLEEAEKNDSESDKKNK